MSDITMCQTKECLFFQKCYRAQARPSKRQSYFMGNLKKDNMGHDMCDMYWPINERKKKNENSMSK